MNKTYEPKTFEDRIYADWEKKKYFVCPNCGRALCPEEKLWEFADNYCGKCGCEIVSAKKEAMALTGES